MEQFRNYEIEEAIEHRVDSIIEQVLWSLEDQGMYRERAMQLIAECDGDETAASHLAMEHQLSVVEEGADDCGFGILMFQLDTLRRELESHAAMFIQLLAEGRAYGLFEKLFDFMQEHDFTSEQMSESNPLEWMAHRAEREEDGCTVYEYKDVEEPGRDIDIWEYRLRDGWSVFIAVRVNSDS